MRLNRFGVPHLLFLAVTSTVVLAPGIGRGEGDLNSARQLWLTGAYGEALESLGQLDGEDPLVAGAKALCHESQGNYADALRIVTDALKSHPDSAALLAQAARLNRLTGRYDEAITLAARAIAAQEDHLPGRWEEVLALTAKGRHDEVAAKLEFFIDFYNDKQPTDAETLYYVALGAAEYARRSKLADEFDFILNTLLVDCAAADAQYWPAHWLSGDILLEKYNKAEAVPSLQKALKINPSATEALVSLGVSSLREWDFPNGYNFARQALDVNPNAVDAHCLMADLLILDERVDEAMESVAKALAVNPASEEALGRLAACHSLQQREEEVQKVEEQALAVTPKPGVFYSRLGQILELRRQFDRAETALKKAIEAAPHLAEPRNELGMLYMRVGREDEARQVFAEAFEIDPFHVRVANMKKVLRHLEDYQILTSPHYELWISGDQDGLLGPYMIEHLEATHAELCQRFGYEPKGLTKIQIMKSHQWFSARVVGLPSIGTVGACTGDVVALASPQSLPSSYNWARVLTHEVTHVITLQQTGYRIPHWYTEALAVMSEGYPRPEDWNDLLIERVPKRDLLNLDTINHAFVRPKTPVDWQMAYCQAQLYAEYMLARFGEDALAKLLDAYAKGMPTEIAIRAVFGVTKEEFEAGYVKHLDELVRGLGSGRPPKERSLAEVERAYTADPTPDLAAELALHYLRRKNIKRARGLADDALANIEHHPVASYVLARMEFSIGKTKEAAEYCEPALKEHPDNELLIDLLAAIRVEQKDFESAARLYQTAHEKQPYKRKWVEGLAKTYLKLDDREKLEAVLEMLANMDPDNALVRQKLAQLALERKDWERAAAWARRTMHITVKSPEVHRILARASSELGDHSRAVREYEVIEQLSPDSLVDAIALAKAYQAAGENEKAAEQVRKLRERAPNNEDVERLAGEMEKP